MKQTGERGAHAPRSPVYTLSLFHSTVAVLFCMTKQVKECIGRDTNQIFSAFRIVDTKVIGVFCSLLFIPLPPPPTHVTRTHPQNDARLQVTELRGALRHIAEMEFPSLHNTL